MAPSEPLTYDRHNCKRNCGKTRSTRHRAVLHLLEVVDVYDMRNASNNFIGGIITASLNATPLMKTKTISTLRLKKRCDGSELADMGVIIHDDSLLPSTVYNNFQGTSLSFVISMPQTWSPRLYLAMVNASIRKYKVISLETIYQCIGGCYQIKYSSLNTVHCNYDCFNLQMLIDELLSKGAYADVVGGMLIH